MACHRWNLCWSDQAKWRPTTLWAVCTVWLWMARFLPWMHHCVHSTLCQPAAVRGTPALVAAREPLHAMTSGLQPAVLAQEEVLLPTTVVRVSYCTLPKIAGSGGFLIYEGKLDVKYFWSLHLENYVHKDGGSMGKSRSHHHPPLTYCKQTWAKFCLEKYVGSIIKSQTVILPNHYFSPFISFSATCHCHLFILPA